MTQHHREQVMSLYQKFWCSYDIDGDNTVYIISRFDSRLELARIDSTHELFMSAKCAERTFYDIATIHDEHITADERDSLEMIFDDMIVERDDWSDFCFEVDI
jgi:hypothetical protein